MQKVNKAFLNFGPTPSVVKTGGGGDYILKSFKIMYFCCGEHTFLIEGTAKKYPKIQ